MRLKYLFLPTVLLVVIAISAVYIYPNLGALKQKNADYQKSKETLQGIFDKKTALETLSSKLKQDEETNLAVLNYLPQAKSEERIIGGANYLATDAGVSLANVMVKAPTAPVAATAAPVAAPTPVDAGVATDPAAVVPALPLVENTEATISVKGDYDKLKIFFSGIEHMPLYNNVKSLSISSETSESEDPNLLSATMVVDFGSMKSVKASSKKISDFAAVIDNKTIEALAAYTSKKVPNVGTDLSTGKGNPFLP